MAEGGRKGLGREEKEEFVFEEEVGFYLRSRRPGRGPY